MAAAAKKMVGMVHVRALPGTPQHSLSLPQIIEKAVAEADCLLKHGFDALLIENMHDTPYLMHKVGPGALFARTPLPLR